MPEAEENRVEGIRVYGDRENWSKQPKRGDQDDRQIVQLTSISFPSDFSKILTAVGFFDM